MQRVIRTIGAVFILGSLLALTPGAWAQDGQGQEQPGHSEPQDTHAAAQDEHGEANSHEDAGHEQDSHAGGHEADPGMHAAEALAVEEPPSWYGKVIIGCITLFVLAATLGSVAVLTKAPEPAEPDHHDDHGHDHGGHGHH
ncbi:MAG: hypothetical protein IT430_15875 [Phycisphaerales bacterium]|nr:hypothetical protein [Phycisphaerales bacterium]